MTGGQRDAMLEILGRISGKEPSHIDAAVAQKELARIVAIMLREVKVKPG